MTTVYSTQKTKWDQNIPSEDIKPHELRGRVRIAYADYEAAALSSGDVIEMFNLPNGARILDGYLLNDALGASTTLSVGYAAHAQNDGTAVSLSAAAYLAATSTSSAARTDVAATLALLSGSVTDVDSTGLPVTVTLGGASATGTIALMMRYVVD